MGNTAFFGGATLSKPLTNHLLADGGLTLFTTAFYNVYKEKPTGLAGQDRYYYAVFLTPDINYKFGNKKSLLNASIKIGPSLKYQTDKILTNYLEKSMPMAAAKLYLVRYNIPMRAVLIFLIIWA